MYRVATASRTPGFRRARGPSGRRYRIEEAKGDRYLAEYRSPGQQPFRCPRGTYDTFAEVMGKSADAQPFQHLPTALRKRTTQTCPDYLPRVCLRFWLSVEPPLVEKVRAMYRPKRAASFKRDARRAWRELESRQP